MRGGFLFCTLVMVLMALPVFAADAFSDGLREKLMQRRDAQQESGGGVLGGRTAGRQMSGLPEGAQEIRDLAYGPHARQKVDVFLPAAPQNAPIILMVHGGAWITGDKANPGVVGNKAAYWLPQGYIVVSANYRMVPDDADPYTQALDVAAALAYVQKNAAAWGGDTARIVLMGHSAGAHLVGLLGVRPDIAYTEGAAPWRGVVMLDSGAIDVVALMKLPHAKFYDKAFGTDEELWHKTSLTRQLQENAVPLLLVCSSKRKDKPCLQGEALVKMMQHKNLRAEILRVAKGHGAISLDLGKADDDGYTTAVDGFIQSVMK